ncbi:MAG: SH3 domain-containing protein, partial [Bacteroidota bacterium]
KKLHLLLLIFLGLIFASEPSFGQEYLSAPTHPTHYFDFKVGQKVYVFGDRVNVRDVPTTKGHILTTLSVGAIVEVVEVLTIEDQMPIIVNGLEGPWVRVKYDDSGASGFIWAPLLTSIGLPTPHYTYLFGLVKADEEKLYGQLRAIKYNDIWEKIDFEAIGDLEHFLVHARIYGNRGYKAFDHIIELHFESSEGIHGLGHLTFFNSHDGVYYAGRHLQHVNNDYKQTYNHLVYPNDKGGQTNRILKRKKVFISDDIGNREITETLTVWDWHEALEKLVRVKQ